MTPPPTPPKPSALLSPEAQLLSKIMEHAAKLVEHAASIRNHVRAIDERAMPDADSVPPMRAHVDTHRGIGGDEIAPLVDEILVKKSDKEALAAMRSQRETLRKLGRDALVGAGAVAIVKIAEFLWVFGAHHP